MALKYLVTEIIYTNQILVKVKAVPNEWNIYCNEIAMILAGNTGILLVINHTSVPQPGLRARCFIK